MMTGCALAALLLALPPDAPARPTTKEEFAALAKAGPNPPWLPFPGVDRVGDDHVYGTVVSVSDDAIEIRPEGKKETVKFPPHVLLGSGRSATGSRTASATCWTT